ncbi:MFS transporter [Sulfobacillus harzensis]|uniref:MFS transporter n=1 Tax=Sulfobacillus harzensis TaxID=2729629 RepID=A0A7Y0L8E1_9FIRM|nr:MFS transporter [Sulfobacillus harzensis]NMP25105.1 MFS transporter [Sulfobacillus harzensis]
MAVQKKETGSGRSGGSNDEKSHAMKLWVLCLVPFIMVLGNSMLIPVLPKMMKVMNLTLFQVGLVITIFSIPAGIIIPFAGALSDRIGRRVIMAPSLILYGLGGLGAGFASWLFPHPYGWIMASRLAQGIGAGGTYQLAMAVAGDMFQSKKRASALGVLEASNGLGKVISPIAGSALALVIWFLPFFAYGVLSFPVAALVWFIIQEPKKNQARGGIGQYWQGLKHTFATKGSSILATFLGGAAVLFILFGVLSYLADILEKNFGYGEIVRGMLIAIPVLASAITSYISGTVLQKKIANWAKKIVILGMGLIALAMVIEPFFATTNVVLALAILVLQGIGTGSVLPSINTMVTSATTSKERGVVTSLYGSVRFFGVAMGPPLFSMAMTHRFVVFWAAAGLAVATGLVAWFLINQRDMLPKKIRGGGGSSKGGHVHHLSHGKVKATREKLS